ncbi:uncharacterized protein FOMMEDRAFT_113456 [Fomitiporia mediterranea MF3/22]|uniref:uncharacterized protein n=1 Tax=Fomitiporia mediterranea (strain MF3/22) TaxID=694068 RepID=UPI0004409C60|nr:uncharacterized protein FOMMEDRAFT_113456 [Fomitiporia mediterranea MF3/22]EJC98891.1 hypothetical protein FOMMEDRAFT_113456 [Fomitiporia mediterranea MF3/22]
MDDILEKPNSELRPSNVNSPEDAGQSSDEDDGGPDWTKVSGLASLSSSKPSIPKRGDKEFEPAGGVDGGGTGTSLQQHKLDRVRAAMFSALDVERTISSKTVSYSEWCRNISRARILSGRGNYLNTLGHNVPREYRSGFDDQSSQNRKKEKEVVLLPEEALYLIERGSMFCWSQIDDTIEDEGTPMSLQQAYAEMIGKEDLTLERYQVYAYLKRLGYTVIRAQAPSRFYVTAPPFSPRSIPLKRSGKWSRVLDIFLLPFKKMFSLFASKFDWWRPLRTDRCFHRFLSFSSVFSSLRFLKSGYSHPLPPLKNANSPYEVFFHVYKPATPYRKTAPPPPDYSVIVVNGRETPMPSLHELCSLFEQLPELPPPVPRKKFNATQQNSSSSKNGERPQGQTAVQASHPRSLFKQIRNFLQRLFPFFTVVGGTKSLPVPVRNPNPFQTLRMGKKMIVVASVDSGMISFFRFCQGSFDEWPMI